MKSRSWVEISASSLKHNLKVIRSRLRKGTAIMPVVKANAYGHGLLQVAGILRQEGISRFAVAQPAEGLELRQALAESEILVFGGCQENEGRDFIEHRLTATIHDTRPVHPDLAVEVKIDTGMTRIGIPWEEAAAFLRSTPARLQGVYSHFARADADADFSRLQMERFLRATHNIPQRRHIANSAGLRFPEAHLDLVRVGLALYGVAPCPGFEDLRPALTWKSRLMAVRRVKAGQWVGYGTSFRSPRESVIGVLPVGYADGYRRVLSNQADVLARGHPARVVGSVSMDLTCIDLTDIEGMQPGTEVELLSADPDSPLSCGALARLADTIPYEILTGIGPRVERRYVD